MSLQVRRNCSETIMRRPVNGTISYRNTGNYRVRLARLFLIFLFWIWVQNFQHLPLYISSNDIRIICSGCVLGNFFLGSFNMLIHICSTCSFTLSNSVSFIAIRLLSNIFFCVKVKKEKEGENKTRYAIDCYSHAIHYNNKSSSRRKQILAS